ncbi:DUF3613 domain-containing protein [Stenotrophomonas acidaminiphila]
MNRSILLLGLLLAMAWSPARAQHLPLTARTDMPTTPPTAAAPAMRQNAVPMPVADAPASAPPGIGDTTRALLRLQADGTQAGNALPMLGEAASRSYKRYLDSFEHPIPEWFDAALPASESGAARR